MGARDRKETTQLPRAGEVVALVRSGAQVAASYRVVSLWHDGAILAGGPPITDASAVRLELEHTGMQLALDGRVVRSVDLGGYLGLEVVFVDVDPAVSELLDELELAPASTSRSALGPSEEGQ